MVATLAQRTLRLSPLMGLLLGVALEPAHAQTLTSAVQSQLARWYRSASRSANGTWGIAIANQQGDLLWSVRPNQPMIPASTVKLLTTGFARTVLGGDARLATRVVGEGSTDPNGEWRGSWALELNGDPSLERPTRGGPTLSDLAWQLADRGIRKLNGPLQVTSANGPANVVYPEAWSPHHWGRVFAPLIGPITLNENVVYLTIRPGGKLGTKARLVSTIPQGLDALVTIHAQTWKGARSRLALRRMADGGWLITGSIGINALPRRLTSVAGNPKAVLAETWAKALHEAGIVWDRTPESSVVPPVPTVDSFDQVPERPADTKQQVLAEVTSAPFDSLASEINRRSLNIGAELLLQWAAGRDDAAEQLTQHVQEVTGVQDGIRLVDGSGLSAEDRLTPATFVHYLARFPETPAGRNFAQLLPANGVGTLRPIGWGLPEPGVVHAKTGTLGGVSTLVGYLGRRDGVLLISVMYNGGRARTAKRAQWNLFRLLGADGVSIPADTTEAQGDEDSADDSDQMGGEGQ